MSGYYPSYPGGSTVVVTAPRCSTAHIVIAWVLTVLTLGYLLPWAIAASRGHRDVGGIALVDLLLGWSLVGWIVALVWSLGDTGGRHQVVVINQAANHTIVVPTGYPQVTTYTQSYPQPHSQPSASGYPQPYGQPSAGYPQLPPAQPWSQPPADPAGTEGHPTQPLPMGQPSADQWQPAPWDRPTGSGPRG